MAAKKKKAESGGAKHQPASRSTRPPVPARSARSTRPPLPPPPAPPPVPSDDVDLAGEVPALPRAPGREFTKKWGPTTADYGYTMVPNALLEGQHRIGISDASLVVLVNLLKFWREKDSRVFPSQKRIAASMGKTPRTVQRALSDLSKLVTVKARRHPGSGNYNSNEYSFEGLIEALAPIAKDLSDARAKARAEREAATRPGFRYRKGAPRPGGAT